MSVGRTVAERLGFRYVDDEVIEQAGEWVDLAPEFVADAERRKPFLDRLLGKPLTPAAPTITEGRTLPGEEDLRSLIKQVLTAVAAEGSAVIVSHAASFALSGPSVLRVFVTASPETRARRLAEAEGLDAREGARRIEREDAGRADYLRRFYGVRQELPTHFDLVVNTDVLSPDRAGDVILAAAGQPASAETVAG